MFHRYKLNIFGFFCFLISLILFFFGYYADYTNLTGFYYCLSGIFALISGFFVTLMILKKYKIIKRRHKKVIKKHHSSDYYKEMTPVTEADLKVTVLEPTNPTEAETDSDFKTFKTYPKGTKFKKKKI